MGNAYVGASGYTYQDWKGSFYPPHLQKREWLSFYARYFTTVEINSSFYGTVREETYKHWYEQTPKGFSFALKGHRYITQLKRLKGIDDAVKRFFDPVHALKEKLSVILWQFPSQFTFEKRNRGEHLERLEHFLSILPKPYRYALEFRHKGWFCDEAAEILLDHNAAFVMSHSPFFPFTDRISADFTYLRFHGPTLLYASSYSVRQLQEWSRRIARFLTHRDVYAYFNNDLCGMSVQNAAQLAALVKRMEHLQFRL